MRLRGALSPDRTLAPTHPVFVLELCLHATSNGSQPTEKSKSRLEKACEEVYFPGLGCGPKNQTLGC
jgi:hypothetical protein